MADRIGKPVSQRQLRVGEMIKQSLGMIFARNEAKVPDLETNTVTVTEVKMSQDLKIAKANYLPNLSIGHRISTLYLDNVDDMFTFNEQLENNQQSAIYMSLNIPIFNN